MCGYCHSQVAQFYCQDCKHFFCDKCRQELHDAMKFLEGHTMISVSDNRTQVQEETDSSLFTSCEKHKGQQLNFYCTDDDVVVCRDCILTKHNKHNCVDIADIAETHKKKIESAFNNLSKNIALFENAELEVSKQQKNTTDSKNRTVIDIQQQENNAIEEVRRISGQLITEAEAHAKTSLKHLEAEKDHLQLQKASIHSTCEFAKQLVQHGSHTEVMIHAKNIQARMRELNEVKPTVQAKTTEITFSKQNVPVDCFGCVKKFDWRNTALLVGGFDTSMEYLWDIACCQSGTIYLVDAISNTLTCYMVIFQADVPNPRGVTVLSDDRLVVTCQDGCRVYSSSGKHVRTFGQGDMSNPRGVTVDNYGYILVCDQSNKCVCVYGAVQYNLISKITLPMCKDPEYIAVLPCRDTIVVSDWSGHCVYGVTPQSDVVFQYGSPGEPGSGDGYLYHPWGVCTDSVGHIFIADHKNNRVVVLTSDGQLFRYVVGPQQVSAPMGVTIDNKGQLVVGEFGGEVKKFRFVN